MRAFSLGAVLAIREFELFGGETCLVDAEDWPYVSRFRWRLQRRTGGIGTAVVCGGAKNGTFQILHRALLSPPEGMMVDHINGDVTDNRRLNLRICSHAQNMRNRKRHSNNRSGYKGVYYDQRRCKYQAQIKYRNKKYYLGMFDSAEDAHAAYSVKASQLHGEFARLT